MHTILLPLWKHEDKIDTYIVYTYQGSPICHEEDDEMMKQDNIY